jgi:transcriptional regulator
VFLLLTVDNNACNLVVVTRQQGGIVLQVPTERLQGTLDLLILRSLSRGPAHGWAVAEHLQLVSREVLRVGQGSLYPALHRLESSGWISAEWGVSSLGRRAKFYALTKRGRKHLAREQASWREFVEAVGRVLDLA